MSLQRKILTRTYVLTLLLIVAMSATYYFLFTNDIRQRSQQDVDQTYALIFDDLLTRAQGVETKLEEFTTATLVSPLYTLRTFREQTGPDAQADEVWLVKRQMAYVSAVTTGLRQFGTLVEAAEIQVYDAQHTLLAVYQGLDSGGEGADEVSEADGRLTGVYLPNVGDGVFVRTHPDDLWYATMQSLDEMPQQPLPDGLLTTFAGEIPQAVIAQFSALRTLLTVQFVVPVLDRGTLEGVCVIQLAIRQRDVERYAQLSGTEVSVFYGDKLSVCTLPEHAAFNVSGPRHSVDVHAVEQVPATAFSTVHIGEHSYYQGILAFGDADTLVGAIAVNFPRQREQRQIRRFFLIVIGITAVFSGAVAVVAFGLSAAIVRPVTRLMTAMQSVETGRFDATAPVDTQDEIGKLAAAFNTMTAQIQAGFAKIKQQNRELHHLDTLKDEFLANTSHELRTPLHGISGLADIILRGADGPITDEARAHLQMIVQSSKRMGRLVDSLLDFSKVRSGTLQLHRSPFPLSEVTEVVATFFSEMFSDKPVELKVDLPGDLPEIYGDIERVEQILTNLVGNAFKFTREGTITIAARDLTPQPPLLGGEGEQDHPSPSGRGAGGEGVSGNEVSFVQITVTDTGIGIPADALGRIFHSFEQVDGSVTREFGGTGLGLAITKNLVELHGGDIRVESTEGQGSTFTVLLPCSPGINPRAESSSRLKPANGFTCSDVLRGNKAECSQGASPVSGQASASLNFQTGDLSLGNELTAPSMAEPPTISGEGRTILIIDDDATNVEVLRTQLEHAGFSVMTATDGQHAFEVINGFEIDLILCDVMMPLVDGYTFATQMRDHEQLRDIPLVIVSAKDRKSDMLRGYQVGGIEYITKPVDREALLLKITAILSHQQRVRERYVPAGTVRTTNHVYDTNHDKEDAFTHVPSGHGEHILVVDDEPINIEVYKSHLAQHGYQVLAASNGPDALDLIDREQPDLVLLDLMMPKMSGFRVCQILRQEKHLHHLPVIMLTAKSHIYDKVYGLNVGANDYLVKPFHPDELLTRMHVLLNATALQQELIDKQEHLQAEIIERQGAEERYRAIADTALDSIFCKDTERRYTFINPAMERLFGVPVDTLLGKTPEELFDPESAAIIAEVDMAALAGETVSEIRDLPIQGEINTFHTIQVPLRDAEDSIIGISGIVRDITPQRKAEEEIRQLNEELELRVLQRTAELEAANRELKDFAYVVSHDLKAPLRGIKRLAGWFTQDYADAFDDKGREMVDLLRDRVTRMNGLIDGILAYSRVGRVEEHKEMLDLNALVTDVIDSLSLPAHIQVSITDDLPDVTADRIRMTQVFQNLLSNAVKFLDKPEGRISVSASDDGDCWRISVADNGPGIEARHHERIFQIFQTLTSPDEHESTGVGLSIVKKIVELQGGKIWVESQPGEGATFFFTLPKS
jgi:PAS domain S-box-containing protein